MLSITLYDVTIELILMCTDLIAYLIKLYYSVKFWDLVWCIKNDIYDSNFRLNDYHNFIVEIDDNYKYVKNMSQQQINHTTY
jgi:hypothetical protein